MRALILTACFMASPALAGDTYRCGSEVVATGAPVAKLSRACGQPSRIAPIQNRWGAVYAERWEYDRNGQTAIFYVVQARVAAIEVIR